VALVFWKDSLDFNRIIVKQMDHVESKGNATHSGVSPDKNRITTYRKAAEDAIQNYRAGQGAASRSAFGSGGGAFGMTGTSNNNVLGAP